MASVFRSIKEIIDSLELNKLDSDNVISNAPRWYIKKLAVKGVKEFTEKETAQVGSLRMTVGDNNQITLPADYVKYLRISELNVDTGMLHPIAVNGSITTANSYLLDNLGKILLDDDGVELTGSGDTDVDRFNTSYDFNYSGCGCYLDPQFYYGNWGSYGGYCDYYNINHSFVRDISFREDVTNNIIQFQGRQLETVILEYKIDPLKNVGDVEDLEIDELFGDALEKYIVKEIVLPRRSVDKGNKYIAKQEYKEAILKAKIEKLTPDINSLTSTTNLK